MATISQALEAKMLLDTSVFMREIKKAQRQTSVTSADMTGAFTAVGISITGLTAKVLNLAKSTASLSITFEHEMAAVHSLIANESKDTIQKYGDDVLDLAAKLGKAPAELARALYDEISAGALAAGDNLKAFTELVVKSAVAGRANTQEVASVMLGVINAYGLELKDTTRVANTFFNIIKYGKTTFPELTQTISRVTSTAAIAKIEMEDLGAALATLTQMGKPTEIAITELRAVMNAFIKPTEGAVKAAEAIGFELSARKLEKRGLIGAMKDLHDTGKLTAETLGEIFDNTRSFSGAGALLSEKGVAIAARDMKDFTENATAMEDAFSVATATVQFEIDTLKSSTQALAIGIGTDLQPSMGGAIKSFKDILIPTLEWIKSSKVLVKALNVISISWNVLKGGAFPIITGLVKLTALFTTAWENAGNLLTITFGTITHTLANGLNFMVGSLKSVLDKLAGLSNSLSGLDPSGFSDSMTDSFDKASRSLDSFSLSLEGSMEKDKDNIMKATKDIGESWDNNFLRHTAEAISKASDENSKATLEMMGWSEKANVKMVQDAKNVSKETQQAIKDKNQFFNEKLKQESDAEFKKELEIKRQIEETTRWAERQYKIETDTYLTELKKQVSAKEKVEGKLQELSSKRASQAESFEEKLWEITMTGLSEAGKRIQKFGIADTFEIRASRASNMGDFEEARRLAQKAQDQFSNIATTVDIPEEERKKAIDGFKRTQSFIEGAFQSEEDQQRKILQDNEAKILDLSSKLKELQSEATIRLKFLVDNNAAIQEIDRLKDLMRGVSSRGSEQGLDFTTTPSGSMGQGVTAPTSRPVFPGGAGLPTNSQLETLPLSQNNTTQNNTSNKSVTVNNNFDIKTKVDRAELRDIKNELLKQFSRLFDSQHSTGSSKIKPGSGRASNGQF